ncbi:SRPBCC family protein [Saccharopolyspora rosea]|uniref:SRPBCC family protein n=1 Tax=Saccharopolyspora rosea TaxID=524884 RepID=A0ABW3FV40_9PSEU
MAGSEDRAGGTGLLEELPLDDLKGAVQDLALAVVERALGGVTGKLQNVTGRLTDYAENGGTGLVEAITGGSGVGSLLKPLAGAGGKLKDAGLGAVKDAGLGAVKNAGIGAVKNAGIGAVKDAGIGAVKNVAKNALSSGDAGQTGKAARVTNIIEHIDVGVPVRTAYDQWTLFEEFPSFTRKVQNVEQQSDERLKWEAKIFLSNRSWVATIDEQVPDERIVWRSEAPKGYPDGTVTFHELGPEMTRILLVIEYHPQGFLEKTANLWRAQGRRVRSDLRHFQRHVMRQTILEADELQGWRGEIRDGEVVKTHDDAVREEKERGESESADYAEQDEGYDEDEYGEESDEDEYGEESEHDEESERDEDEQGDYEAAGQRSRGSR